MKTMCFEWDRWQCNTFSAKEDAMRFIRDACCIGKKLQSIRTIGNAYEYKKYYYNDLEDLARRKLLEAGFSFDEMPVLDDVQIPCKVSLSAPVSLVFSDGAVLDIATGPNIKIGSNSIPLSIQDSINPLNFDIAQIIPQEMIGSKLETVCVDYMDRTDTLAYGKYYDKQTRNDSGHIISYMRILFEFDGGWSLLLQPCQNALFSMEIEGNKPFTYADMAKGDLHRDFIPIEEFACGGGDVCMRPAKFLLNPDGSHVMKQYGGFAFDVYDDMIVLEEGDLSCCMEHLLDKYYDPSVNTPDHEERFDYYDDTFYRISSIQSMLEDLETDLAQLEKDIDSEQSRAIIKRTRFCKPGEIIRDFYRRFIPRMKKLIADTGEYDLFVFIGN